MPTIRQQVEVVSHLALANARADESAAYRKLDDPAVERLGLDVE